MGSEDSDRWQQIKDLYDAVIHLGPIERERVLDAACRCDAELRREVESLREDRAADFMESPAYKVLANFPTSVRLKKLECSEMA